jgi:hypothetical protein
LLERFFDLLDLRLRVALLRDLFFELRVERFFDPAFFGTFAPRLRASESPIAIACFRLLTFLPDRPLFSLPRLYSCIALFTLRCDVLPYLAMFPVSFAWQRCIVAPATACCLSVARAERARTNEWVR